MRPAWRRTSGGHPDIPGGQVTSRACSRGRASTDACCEPESDTYSGREGLSALVWLCSNCRKRSSSSGVSPRNHRTDSIDYAVVMSGEVEMVLDETTVHLKAGDVLVQRGTIHNWVNRGTAPCVIAFVLISAKSATASGRVLRAEG